MMPEKDTRWLSRGSERWDPQHIREKLRSMPVQKKKECKEKQIKGPMVVKPNLAGSSASLGSMERLNVAAGERRSPSPHSDSPFKQQVVNGRPGSPSSPRISRRRNTSPVNSRPSSPTTLIRRTPSPHSEGNQIIADEIFKKRVEKALHARLYLLHQIGPKCFLIGGDSPDHKYKVVVGPQTCSCNKGQFCVHVLFVMLRMFQVQENDPRLLCKTLRNYEVEDLVQRYLDRRKGKLKKPNVNRKESGQLENLELTGSTDSLDSRSSCSSEHNGHEETCPICLLEMIEGESLVICQDGCHNRLHHHCVMIWAENCSKENESLSCPLCRIKWTVPVSSDDTTTTTSPESLNARQISPTQMLTATDTVNSNVPALYKAQYTTWTKVIGEDLVSGLFSREWSLREVSLHQISHHIRNVLQAGASDTVGPHADDQELREVTEIGLDIVAVMCEDPVYKVYVSSLKMLRCIISNETCFTENKKNLLQQHLKPVLEAILLKCADSNRRTSQLSVSAIVELCKGQEGELAIGRLIQNPENGMIAIWCVDYFLSTMLVDGTGWQWWLGRLNTINELFNKFPSEFTVSAQNESLSEDHIMTILKFVFKVVGHTHMIVSKLARRIFTIVTRSVVHDMKIINKVVDLMAELEPQDRGRLDNRLRKILDDYEKVYEKASYIAHIECNSTADGVTENSEINRVCESVSSQCSCGSVDDGRNCRKTTQNAQIKQSKSRTNTKSSEKSQIPLLNIKKKRSSSREKRGCASPQGACASSSSQKDKETCPCNRTSVTGDFSDMSLSPSSPCEKPVTFTTEITTPSHSPESIKYQDKPVKFGNCKEKVELEEAEAIVAAMETSLGQSTLPVVPGLTLSKENQDIVIHLRNEDIANKDQYIEGKHWSRGELIGTGAFSSCYKACDMQTGTIMAVKQVSFIRNTVTEQDKVVDTLVEEISLLSKLDHPNIVRLLGATKHNGHFNMFTEWMPGGSIASILSSFGAFREAVCIGYLKQIFRGLGYLHQKYIIHRDLKGANLLVDSTGQHLRLADFGTAAQMASHLTGAGEFTGQLTGTIAFMAPEVLQGETYGRACDIWSAGCCMIEMITSKPPWDAADISNHLKLIFKIASANGPPPVPDVLSPAARDLVLRCLDSNPKERPHAVDLLLHAVFTRM
ncbi:mitogen-activated protein kinase kinase kinase 1-like isoform X2 [Anneissia japonica]|nr:mitogen-activated protein kinase kinase kinase 1-like isoform X2 [Anneissia japonica]XP_033109317.1 mitogen-activated protein kinase kinase kinase 1-like isoform X2 [Anneissia japonica]